MSNFRITVGAAFTPSNAHDLYNSFAEPIDAYGGTIITVSGTNSIASSVFFGFQGEYYVDSSGALIRVGNTLSNGVVLSTVGGIYANTSNNLSPVELVASAFGSVLIGSRFNDLIGPGPGIDTLTGGGGSDVFSDSIFSIGGSGAVLLSSLQGDIITDFSVDDQIFLLGFTPQSASMMNGILTIAGAQQLDSGRPDFGFVSAGAYAANLSLNTPGFSGATVYVDGVTLVIDSGAASYSYRTLSTDSIVYGTGQPDSLTGGTADVQVLGLGGSDTLVAGAGHDTLFGNLGDDRIVVGATSAGAIVYGGMGNDVIDASASTTANYLSGDLGNDSITAGSGTATLFGGDGSDTLAAGAGQDLIFGNQGTDRLVVGASSQGATVYGGMDDDLIDASAATRPVYLSGDIGRDSILGGGGVDTILGGPGSDTILAATGTVDKIHVGFANSSATAGAAGAAELDHVQNFGAEDQLVFDGGPAGTAANVFRHGGDATIADYAAAYTYAYGDSTHAAALAGAVQYVVVDDTAGHVYVFAANHSAVALDGLGGGVNGVAAAQLVAT